MCADRGHGGAVRTALGFIPAQDQGYFLAMCNCPRAPRWNAPMAVVREVAQRILPIKGMRGAVMFAGFHGPSQTSAPNSARSTSLQELCRAQGRA
jgi:multidrug efflux pump subunit AcrB